MVELEQERKASHILPHEPGSRAAGLALLGHKRGLRRLASTRFAWRKPGNRICRVSPFSDMGGSARVTHTSCVRPRASAWAIRIGIPARDVAQQLCSRPADSNQPGAHLVHSVRHRLPCRLAGPIMQKTGICQGSSPPRRGGRFSLPNARCGYPLGEMAAGWRF